MKHKSYKHFITLFTFCFISTVFAQKFDKKYSENFSVNKDVEVAINASNTEINVTTWNKNEVQVNAFIEVEGLTKKEAEKYFKNWDFEALGNKRKVEITSKGNNSFSLKNDFIFFNDMDFDFPEIKMPDFEMIVLPEMNFDFDFNLDDLNILEDIGDIDEMVGKDGKYSFRWKDDDHDIEINSKKEWEAFKKTKEYKQLKEKMKFDKEKMKKRLADSKEKMKKYFKESKNKFYKIDKEKVKKELAKAKEKMKKMKFSFSSESDDIIINGKKIKIKKRLEIKVPKKATFNLNTRHCKIKLPNTVASGTVKYGSFNANNLIGGKLTVNYSPVNINNLNACTLFLNNVTDANIASVTNTSLSNNSSGVNIFRINENVNLSDKFGELTIESFNPNFGEFVINLSHSDAKLFFGTTKTNFKYNVNRIELNNKRVAEITKNAPKNNIVKVSGEYSSLIIK